MEKPSEQSSGHYARLVPYPDMIGMGLNHMLAKQKTARDIELALVKINRLKAEGRPELALDLVYKVRAMIRQESLAHERYLEELKSWVFDRDASDARRQMTFDLV